jgi:serine/threonine protein kinase
MQITSKYNTIQKIGEGGFSEVFLVEKNSRQYVLKRINRKLYQTNLNELYLERELRINQICQHKNILTIKDIIFEEAHVNLISEYCSNGDLFEYIFNQEMLSEKESINFFLQILDGLEYLHSRNVAHCDLKTENIFIDKNKIMKIDYFGFAVEVKENQKVIAVYGSVEFCPPEHFTDKVSDPKKGDIWGAGLILYSMVTGSFPWNGNSREEIVKQILSCQIYYPFNVSQQMRELLKLILKKDPDERLTIKQIRKHIQLNFHTQTDSFLSLNQKNSALCSYPKVKSYMLKILTKTNFH